MSSSRPSQPARYAIRIKEKIPAHLSAWFDGFTITYPEDGGSILSGPVADQPALHGLLAKMRNLNLTLISVSQIESPPTMTNPNRR